MIRCLIKNKSGVSEVVSSILIVMITVFAIFGLWLIVSSVFRVDVVDKAACTLVNFDVGIDEASRFTCTDTITSSVVVYRRGGDDEIVDIKIKYSDENGNTYLEDVDELVESNLDKVYEVSGRIFGAAVVPVIEVSGAVVVCDSTKLIPITRDC